MQTDPNYWWDRAEEARVRAADFADADCRRMMEGIAETYDNLAERLEKWKVRAPANQA